MQAYACSVVVTGLRGVQTDTNWKTTTDTYLQECPRYIIPLVVVKDDDGVRCAEQNNFDTTDPALASLFRHALSHAVQVSIHNHNQ